MPRKVSLAPHFSAEELREKYKKSRDNVEARRWHLLWKVARGWTLKNSAIAVGLNYEYAQKVVKKYNQEGDKGIKNQRNQNHPKTKKHRALLNEEQLNKLKEALKGKPSDGGQWTGPKVARWIEKETGREKVWNQRGWDYLNKVRLLLAETETQARKRK
ncbi:helix-turn-helix domain-containing protein [Baaleninema simplex]|uniref:helix-turn-helix domain-containing protein n=1 Tax=Baaleninema simplex TaxID=2862350 RepID=UPI000476F971|nr:helix-turn-helix domain-containing protein [Baaleninema simplex]